jgi:hypothetical protein
VSYSERPLITENTYKYDGFINAVKPVRVLIISVQLYGYYELHILTKKLLHFIPETLYDTILYFVSHCLDRFWGARSLISNGHREIFPPGVKAAEA